MTRTLTMTYGFRWEYNPAPSATSGPQPVTVNEVTNFGNMTFTPRNAFMACAEG